MQLDPGENIEFECPRCRSAVSDHFYGPCLSCRERLRAEFYRDQREAKADEYIPKMNVTPNAVALKDD